MFMHHVLIILLYVLPYSESIQAHTAPAPSLFSLFRILLSICAGWNKQAGWKASRDTRQSVILYRRSEWIVSIPLVIFFLG